MCRQLVAGTRYNLTVQAVNFYSSPQTTPGDRFCSVLHSHTSEVCDSHYCYYLVRFFFFSFLFFFLFFFFYFFYFSFFNNIFKIECKVTYTGAGKYEICVAPTTSGSGMLTIKKDQLHIRGSPWEVEVLPGM